MPGFDDFLRKAAQIAKEEGAFEKDDRKRDLLPSPGKVKRQIENLSRAAERLKNKTGVDVTGLAHNRTSEASQRPTSPPAPLTEGNAVEETAHPQLRGDGPQDAAIDTDDIIQEQIDVLETWILDNSRLAKRDFARFWALKIPAIFASVSVAAFQSLGYGSVVIVLGVVTAFCVGIDALFPGGRLHNVHKRAANEARRLQHDAIGKWRQAQLDNTTPKEEATAKILDFIQRERTRIDKYVTDAETSLGVTDR
ncbi:MAG: hypothetical protein MI685_10840 [Chlorobiales bacterium]|nr:hypothetical protein [Chlorobiales bacterium]